jgi:hypothetical protein
MIRSRKCFQRYWYLSLKVSTRSQKEDQEVAPSLRDKDQVLKSQEKWNQRTKRNIGLHLQTKNQRSQGMGKRDMKQGGEATVEVLIRRRNITERRVWSLINFWMIDV